MGDKTNRLFIALWPDSKVRGVMGFQARDQIMRNQPGGVAVPDDNLHLTIQFLGSMISPEAENALRAALAKVESDPLSLELDVASCFKTPSVWWLGCQVPPTILLQLRKSIQDALKKVDGLDLDKKRFIPHVTILKGAGRTLPLTKIPAIKWAPSGFSLIRSVIDELPPRYEIVEQWQLTRRTPPSPKQQSLFDP